MARISKNQLLKLRRKYRTDESIARLYGVSRQAIHQLRKRYGIPKAQDEKSERNQSILELWHSGLSKRKIAAKTGLSPSQICRIVRKLEEDNGTGVASGESR